MHLKVHSNLCAMSECCIALVLFNNRIKEVDRHDNLDNSVYGCNILACSIHLKCNEGENIVKNITRNMRKIVPGVVVWTLYELSKIAGVSLVSYTWCISSSLTKWWTYLSYYCTESVLKIMIQEKLRSLFIICHECFILL